MPDILTDDEFPELGQAKNAPIAGNGADTIESAQGNGACRSALHGLHSAGAGSPSSTSWRPTAASKPKAAPSSRPAAITSRTPLRQIHARR